MAQICMSGKRVRLFFSVTILMWAVTHARADVAKGQEYYDQGQYKLAYQEFYESALKNEAIAQYSLGAMFESGDGVAQDYDQAAN